MSTTPEATNKLPSVNEEKQPEVIVTLSLSEDGQKVLKCPYGNIMKRSLTLKNMAEDLGREAIESCPIPVMNVTYPVMETVLKWCDIHKDEPDTAFESPKEDKSIKSTELSEADKSFFGTLDQQGLFDFILAVNYLDIKPALDAGCKTVANMIKGKSPEEIRKCFNIENDFTPEEEEQIRKENEWAEDR